MAVTASFIAKCWRDDNRTIKLGFIAAYDYSIEWMDEGLQIRIE